MEAIISKHDSQSKQTIEAFKRDLQKVKTGRANPSILEGITVDYYGSRTPLQSLGQISAPEPRLITVQIYDASAGQAVEKAINIAGLGFNAVREGNVIRIVVPPLTEETRRDLVKHLHKMAEEIRVSIRNHRRDANDAIKKLEKDSSLTKDDSKRGQDRVQKLTDMHIAEVDKLLAIKEKEILET
ncbi:ribosome recycling factor [bacterium]|nr:ribosome recycling factor [bacterium]